MRLEGVAAGAEIELSASTRDDAGNDWRSSAIFLGGADGVIDLSRDRPLRGSHGAEISAMGLFWSMAIAPVHEGGRTVFAKDSVAPNTVQLEARASGVLVASATVVRKLCAEGTVTRDLSVPNPSGVEPDASTVVGRLFIPAGVGPHPTVVVLSGSGGGFDVDKAAVLSRHGFATFALSYFGLQPLPSWLHRVPLEYFEASLEWLRAQPEVDASRVGIFGISRGAEAALILASRFEFIRSVVAWAPSSTAWAAGGEDKETRETIPCWTWHGKAIPFAPLPLKRFMWSSAFPVAVLKRPVMFVNLFRAALRNRAAVKCAAIPIEKVKGPVLLVSGGDDHLWPAAEMADALVARAKRHGSVHAVEHLNFPRAGHMLRYPWLPTTSRFSRNKHLRGARFSFGGEAAADAEAQSVAWGRSIEFLRASLGTAKESVAQKGHSTPLC